MAEKIIIIEDDRGVRFFLEEALKEEGYTVEPFPSYEDAVQKLNGGADLVIMDISLPGMDGLTAIDDLKKKTNIPVLIITAYGTKKNALEAIKRGATDFFVKPIPLDELKVMVKRILGKKQLKKEVDLIKEKELEEVTFHGVVGKSEQMKEIFRMAEKIAPTELTVLITGETGVGKEEVARLVHKLSGRKGKFVVVNCASIPDNLLESELFGYEKGAFTGAYQQKQGKFEITDRGTIVLDEIGEMSPYLQAKLLRVADKKQFERLGSTKTIEVDVRIISTTNRQLEERIKEGKFRDDLFFRLAQAHIYIPPLRERRDDIEVFIDKILLDMGIEKGVTIRVSEETMERLLAYDWPGNVREVINVIKRASIMCEDNIIARDDIPLYITGEQKLIYTSFTDTSLDQAISELEKRMIVDALKKSNGSQARAAKLLGISERSMWYRVKKYEIDVSQ